MKTKSSILPWLVAGFTLFSNTISIRVIAADTNQNYSCFNTDGICIKKIEQQEDRVLVTIHNNLEDAIKSNHYFQLRYSGGGYSSGIIKIRSDQKSYTSKELKLGKVYKFEVRKCNIVSSNKIDCTKWHSKKIKLQG
jgi:hypothetical protein